MQKIKTLVFTTEHDHQWLKDHEVEVQSTLGDVKNANFGNFEYRYADVIPETYVSRNDGKVRISQRWFDNTFTQQARALGYDTAVFHFTTDKRKEWGLHEPINGSYFRDDDKKWEFWLCADKGQRSTSRQRRDRGMSQYVRVFLHEYGHGLVHWWYPDRRADVHEYDYDRRDMKSLFATLEAPKSEPIFIDKRYASSNYWTGNVPDAFVFHTTGGSSLEGAIQTLIARGLSYNYIIHNGLIYELVHWENSAWHAGVVKQPNLRARTFFNGVNPNKKSVGVAFTYPAAGPNADLPDADIDAAVKLMKHVGEKASRRYNADNIFYHQEITVDKPIIVKRYRAQILDAIVGDKNEKDAGEKTRLQLMIQLLKLRIQVLLLRNKNK